MKVAFLAEYYRPFEVGGAERSAARLASELSARGTEMVVATPNYGAPARERLDEVDIHRLPFPQHLVPGQLARRFWLSNPLLQLSYGFLLARLIRKRGVDLLHVQNSGLLLAGALAARLARVPLIVTIRDLAYVQQQDGASPRSPGVWRAVRWFADGYWSRLERRFKRRALASADRVVFVSGALRDWYMSDGSIQTERAVVVYNIAPSRQSAPEPTRDFNTILFVGKLSTGKGLRVLYEAAPTVLESIPAARFILAGSPGVGFAPAPPAISHSFLMVGRVEESRVRRLMGETGVLVAPATWPEPLSRVLLEAMSAGTPIVATLTGGNREMLEHDRSAWLVKAGDPDALARGIIAVLTQPALAARLGQAARERVSHVFSADAVIPQIVSVYRQACEAR